MEEFQQLLALKEFIEERLTWSGILTQTPGAYSTYMEMSLN